MCHQYSKLPTEEMEREEKREKTSDKTKTKKQTKLKRVNKQTKWKRVKKAAGRICNFFSCDLKLSDLNFNQYYGEPLAYSTGYALGGVVYS